MITVDKALFRKVFREIFDSYLKEQGIFATHRANVLGPQHQSKPGNVAHGSKEHLYWLALVALSDKRTSSEVLYRNFARMHDEDSTLFLPGHQPTLAEAEILFRRYQIALPVKEIGFFLKRKEHLDVYFKSDPFNLYEGTANVEALMEKIRDVGRVNGVKNLFPGAKEKMFCLLWMFLREFRDMEFAEVVPVDVWVQAIAASTGILKGNGRIVSQTLEKRLRPLMTEVFGRYRNDEGAANATWILGRHGCRLCSSQDMEKMCPVYKRCQGPFERTRHPVSGKHLGVITLPLKLRTKCRQRKLI